MPQIQVDFHRLAQQEYNAAVRWYAEHSDTAAERFRAGVAQTVMRIAEHPDTLPRLTGAYRCAKVPRFPYLLIVREHGERKIIVVAVAHASRRPGYWKRRN